MQNDRSSHQTELQEMIRNQPKIQIRIEGRYLTKIFEYLRMFSGFGPSTSSPRFRLQAGAVGFTKMCQQAKQLAARKYQTKPKTRGVAEKAG